MRFLFLLLLSVCGGVSLATGAAAEHVLYVGDSHSYIADPWSGRRLGHVLIEHFKSRRIPLHYYAACGASARSWSAGGTTGCGFTRDVDGTFFAATRSSYPAVSSIFDPVETSLLIVNLGDNIFAWSGKPKLVASLDPAVLRSQVDIFFGGLPAGAVDSSRCVWIGPAYHAEGSVYRKPNAVVDQFYREFAGIVAGRCRLVDSRPMVPSSVANDGLHFVERESALWGEGILQEL